ncbi:hypothetical protein [Streptomyces vinaceus]|uniref:hypothetical protein n=1 Tax=Streptomyces vinaceus TaxID=1960 RepID=UPI0037F4C117
MRPCTLTVFCFGVASGLVALAPAAAMALGGADEVRPPEPAPASASAAPTAPEKASEDADGESAATVGPSVTAAEPAAREKGADLSVSGTLRPAGPSPRGNGEVPGAGAAVRETFDYAVTVTNHGPSDARQVTVTDHLPPSLEFVSSRDGCTAAGRTVTCGTLALLPADRSHTWVITVRLAAGYRGDGSDIVNEAVVGAETSDPDQTNNKTSLTGLDIPPSARVADLSLEKTALLGAGREAVRPGEKFVYLITVHNHGPATARTVRVSDLLPPSLTLLSSPDDCAVPKGEDRLVVCPPQERLESGAKAEFRITVKAKAEAKDEAADEDGADRGGGSGRTCLPIDNIARVTSATFDPDPSDNANRPGTTAPGGGPLCLETGEADHHGGRPGHRPDGHGNGGHREEGRENGHGRGDGHGHGHGSGDGREHGSGPEHGRDGDGDGSGHGHGGHLADSGSAVPAWLLQAPGGLVAGGAALRAAARRRPQSNGGADEETENAPA